MGYCKKCGDTGRTVNGKYCNCKQGRWERTKDEVEKKAREAAETAAQKLVKGVNERKPMNSKNPIQMDMGIVDEKEVLKESIEAIKPGDWVVITNYHREWMNGTLCEVLEVETNKMRVEAKGSNKDGLKMTGKGWFKPKYIELAPIKPYYKTDQLLQWVEQQNLKRRIDAALDSGDKELFYELAGRLDNVWS